MKLHNVKIKNAALKCLFATLVLLLLLGLTACKDDGWKEYYTPELFLDKAIEHRYVTVTSTELDGEVMDYGLVIKNLILDIDGFEETEKRAVKSERYISYKILIALSTAGPNYSDMYLYDDGYLEIVYKSALGDWHRFYYSFDAAKAPTLVEKIENRITENLQEHTEND